MSPADHSASSQCLRDTVPVAFSAVVGAGKDTLSLTSGALTTALLACLCLPLASFFLPHASYTRVGTSDGSVVRPLLLEGGGGDMRVIGTASFKCARTASALAVRDRRSDTASISVHLERSGRQ